MKVSIYSVFKRYPLDWLERAISGVRCQRYKNTEYVFVIYGKNNDLDGILNLLTGVNVRIYYKPEIENFIEIIRFAVDQCSGEYVLRADAEDRLYPEAIETMLKYDGDMIIPNHMPIDVNGRILNGTKPVKGNVHDISSNCLIRKSLIQACKFHNHQSCRDGYALVKYINHAGLKLTYIDEALFFYRFNPEGITNNSRSKEMMAFNEWLVNSLYEEETVIYRVEEE